MTNRDFYLAVISANISDELNQFALDSIAKLDHRNESRKGKETKSHKENAIVKESILGLLASVVDGMTASEIATALANDEISANRVTALCTQLVKEGRISAEKVKREKSKVNLYKVA